MTLNKVLKYEFLNILRNRWVFIYALIVTGLSFVMIRVSGETQKAVLSLSSIVVVFIPLISSLFTSLYWYYNDRFTQLMLTQPMPRWTLFFSRTIAISLSLIACSLLSMLFVFALFGEITKGVLVLNLVGSILTIVFVSLASWFSVEISDRMKGVGLVFSIWLYFVLVHDGLLLLLLLSLQQYPLEFAGGILATANPIGLARVVLLMFNEGSLLLGHTGALARGVLTSWKGYVLASSVSILWTLIPFYLGFRSFKSKDF